jgi:hypothetical protein
MSSMTITPKHPMAAGQAWGTRINCPGCGHEAEGTKQNRMPKWHCPDMRCDFHYGWRLVPDNGRVFAVPVDDHYELLLAQSVRWAPDLASEPENIPEEERA